MRPALDTIKLRGLVLYYLLTVLIETPVLLVGLSRRHSVARRLFAGVWLNACTYPIVFLVLPEIFDVENERWLYLLVAEVFAPVAECTLFWSAFLRSDASSAGQSGSEPSGKGPLVRDMVVIVLANLASFGIGEAMNQAGWRIPGT